MRSILLAIALGSLIVMALSFCSPAEKTLPNINYKIHYENGTNLSVDQDSSKYAALNDSAMKFLQFIAYASERLVTSDELMKELNGTRHLEITSKDKITIHTKKDLNPGWPQGYEITTKKIMIKLGEAEAEERIFTFHDEGISVRAWRSAIGVNAINL
jgi:hypothetical protein